MTGQLPFVTRAIAMRRQTNHSFHPGLGYLAHSGPPDLPADARGSKNCEPPAGTADGSVHYMQPPGGHPRMPMTWIEAEHAWASLNPAKGNRLAWPVEHLSKAGWEYAEPLKAETPKRRK